MFSIEYAGGVKIHVPVSQAHLLSRYVGVAGREDAKLHNLSGKRWLSEKADAERAVQDLAASLLETQARRSVVPGVAFDPSPMYMQEFEAAFPYTETPDQHKAVEDVKRDMSLPNGTVYNDRMESAAVYEVFGDGPYCSSTKTMTGHALGAAGAIEVGLCWLMLKSDGRLLPHLNRSPVDPQLPPLRLARIGDVCRVDAAISNSFAFGGSNASVIIGRPRCG